MLNVEEEIVHRIESDVMDILLDGSYEKESFLEICTECPKNSDNLNVVTKVALSIEDGDENPRFEYERTDSGGKLYRKRDPNLIYLEVDGIEPDEEYWDHNKEILEIFHWYYDELKKGDEATLWFKLRSI